MVWNFIITYWLEFLFTAMAGAITASFLYAKRNYKKGLQATKREEKDQFVEEIKVLINEQKTDIKNQLDKQGKDLSKQLQDQKTSFDKQLGAMASRLDDLEQRFTVLNNGVLSIQKREFMADCHYLLQDGHVITLDEFDALTKEHKIYNALGGNSDGDTYFNLVKEKYKGELHH